MFFTARSHGDVVTMILLGATMLLLGLTALATVYVIYSTSRMPVQAFWKWSRPTIARRMAGALGAGAVLAFLGFLWEPQFRKLTDKTDPLLKPARAATAPLPRNCARSGPI
jgi:hypothetical protein